jgi:hypothetical protein
MKKLDEEEVKKRTFKMPPGELHHHSRGLRPYKVQWVTTGRLAGISSRTRLRLGGLMASQVHVNNTKLNGVR